MDITQSIAPRSDQLNYEDVALTGPITVTVAEVRKGSAEQPVEIHLVEFPGRPFKPSKTSRRTIVAGWGPETSVYVGRRMTLFGDPSVKWAGKAVGGLRVSHLSHIEKPLTLALTETRGQRKTHTVQPLAEAPTPAPVESPAAKAVTAFESLGVGEDVLVAKFGGRTPDQWSDADLAVLLTIFQSIQSGATTAADEFGGEQA